MAKICLFQHKAINFVAKRGKLVISMTTNGHRYYSNRSETKPNGFSLLQPAAMPPAGGVMKPEGGTYFVKVGEHMYAPTNLTIGPWDANAQHGGPPAALLGHSFIEAAHDPGDHENAFLLSKMSFQLYRPLPVSSVIQLKLHSLQRSKNLRHIEATIISTKDPSKILARAEALLIRETPISPNDFVIPKIQALAQEADALSVPSYSKPGPIFSFGSFVSGMASYSETLDLTGSDLGASNENEEFLKKRIRGILAFGRPVTTDLVRDSNHKSVLVDPMLFGCIWGDAGSGMSAVLSWGKYNFANADFTIHWFRRPILTGWDGPPDGAQRIGMRAITRIYDGGQGVAITEFFDPSGIVAQLTQHLIVKPIKPTA